MHEEETDEDHPESESEVQRRRYSLRKKYQRTSWITVYETVTSGVEGAPKTRAKALSRSD
jgi:hypothetical protein